MGLSTTFTLKFNGAAVERGMRNASESAIRLSSAFLKIGIAGAAVASTAAIAGFVAFVKGASAAASSIEDLTMQFETLTKSAKITKKLVADMKEDAAKSPLSIENYAQAGKTLMAFGMQAEDVMPTLRNLGDVSMGNSERFASLALAFAQTQAAGRLMGQEVLQFVNAGFNPLQQISKRTGETMIQLKKRMEDGAVSSKEVAQAFTEATMKGGLFYKAIERGALTTSGKIAKTKDAILSLKIAFGTGFNDGFKTALDAANQNIPKLMAKITQMGKMLGMTIQDAVNGDLERFKAIGKLIGDVISAGAVAAFQAGSTSIVEGSVNYLKKNLVDPLGRNGEMSESEKYRGASFKELFDAQMTIREVGSQSQSLQQMGKRGIVPNAPEFVYAQPGEPATIMNGERVVRALETIVRHVSPQP